MLFCHSLTSAHHQNPHGIPSKIHFISKSNHSITIHSSKSFSLVLVVFSLLAIFSLFSHPFPQPSPKSSNSPQNSPNGHKFTEQIYRMHLLFSTAFLVFFSTSTWTWIISSDFFTFPLERSGFKAVPLKDLCKGTFFRMTFIKERV